MAQNPDSGGAPLFARTLRKAMDRYKGPGSSVGELARWCKVTEAEFQSWLAGRSLPKAEPARMLRARFPQLRALHFGAMSQMSKDAAAKAHEIDPVLHESVAEALAQKRDAEVQAELQVLPQPSRPPREFGPALRWFRLRDGLGLRDVADLVEVSEAAIRKWEAGEVVPVIPNLLALGGIFPDLARAVETGEVDKPPSQALAVPVGKTSRPVPNVTPIRPAPSVPAGVPGADVAAAGAAYADALRALELAKLSVGQADAAVAAAQEAAIAARTAVSAAELDVAAAADAMTQAVAKSVAASIGGAK